MREYVRFRAGETWANVIKVTPNDVARTLEKTRIISEEFLQQ